jgi:sec-independent protein translocase protein TatB
MFNVGSGEFLVIFLLALIVLGPDKLPETARKVGKVIGDLRQMSSGFQAEMREAMDVDGIKQALNPTASMNEAKPIQYNMDHPTAAIPVSQDPNVPAPIPTIDPLPTPEPTEIRATAPRERQEVTDLPQSFASPLADRGPADAAADVTPTYPPNEFRTEIPPTKGQQGAA